MPETILTNGKTISECPDFADIQPDGQQKAYVVQLPQRNERKDLFVLLEHLT